LQQTSNIPDKIVLKARKGDKDACAQLYQQYSKAMYNVCIRMTGNEDDAADVLQDAFLHAFNHLRQLKQPGAFPGWLKQIVVHQCIRFAKKNIAWDQLNETEIDENADDEMEWWTNIPLAIVHQEIKSLPLGCRQVFVLFAMEDFAHKEIARQLSISESTSKSQYQRARKLLRERISKQMEIHG
jgi:RNA polymerase sigma factor (sigma-70 family)